MPDTLPQLMDARMLAEETGWSRDAAKYWIRSCGLPLVRPPGTRRVYVQRDDVARALEARRA